MSDVGVWDRAARVACADCADAQRDALFRNTHEQIVHFLDPVNEISKASADAPAAPSNAKRRTRRTRKVRKKKSDVSTTSVIYSFNSVQ